MTEIDVSLLHTQDITNTDSLVGLDGSDQTIRVRIPELTQSDIDNQTEVNSILNGKLLAENLSSVGGGTEVLKDWTTVVGNNTLDLLGGVDFGVMGFENCTIEIRNFNADKGNTLAELMWLSDNDSRPGNPRSTRTQQYLGLSNSSETYYGTVTGGNFLSAANSNYFTQAPSITIDLASSVNLTKGMYVYSAYLVCPMLANYAGVTVFSIRSTTSHTATGPTEMSKLVLVWEATVTDIEFDYRIIRK